jgi:hypothetical protein
MPTEDGFNPDHPLPLFLADRAEQQSIGRAFDRAVISSRVSKASILIAAATATGIVVLSMGNHPGTLFADVTASLLGNSGPQPDTDQPESTIQSTPDAPALIQSTADAQALPPTAEDALTGDEIAASEPAGKDQAEKSEPSSEVLFRQFQAWVAEQNAQANVRQQPSQGAPAQVAQNAPARVAENASIPHRLMQRHRHVLSVRDARAEMRTQNFRNRVQRSQSARVERPLIQDARAQSRPVQDLPQVGAAAYGAYDYYGGYDNGCYRDGYGRWVCQQY